jgi:prophage regulatory protein
MNKNFTLPSAQEHSVRIASDMALEVNNLNKVLRLPQLIEILGLSRSTIYAMMNKRATQYDREFPTPIRIGISSSGRGSVGWLAHEVYEYINQCTYRSRVGSFGVSAKQVNLGVQL